MNSIPFIKMQALGNDFIVTDCRDENYKQYLKDFKKLCDPKYGVGCDQLIFIEQPKSKDCHIYLDMYNGDGSHANACGNATRCLALHESRKTGQVDIVIETVNKKLFCHVFEDDRVDVNMGNAKTHWNDIPLSQKYDWDQLPHFDSVNNEGYIVNVGNPHIVFFVDDVKKIDIEKIGPQIENHVLFPEKINVEFVEIVNENSVDMRVWERGVGVTHACGTGACAVGYVAYHAGYLSSPDVTVNMDGGSLLIKNIEDDIMMCGQANYVFEGQYFL